jgi:2-haloacid dehalogenase
MQSTTSDSIQVLAFDVFGTVVDWYTGVALEVSALDLGLDGGQFALDWRSGYAPAMKRVMSGEAGWKSIDELHRIILDDLLDRHGLGGLDEATKQQLNTAWHRLDAWPDSVAGLQRLKSKFMVCTLSNGNIGLLANMAKHAGLPWDCILSAENFGKYKPDPATYLGVARTLGVKPEAVMLVAAHHDDLQAAGALGLRTAFIERPSEFGPHQAADIAHRKEYTLNARSITELAAMLGC